MTDSSIETEGATLGEDAGPRFKLWPKRLLYLLYGVGSIIAVLRLGLPRYPAIAIVVGPVVIADVLLRLLVKPRLKVFNQQLLRLMQEGADARLLAFYAEQRFLRFAGPAFELLDKLGWIHAHLGHFATASDAYRDALEAAPTKRQVEIAIKLADALRMAGKVGEAERYYREVAAVTDEHAPTNQHLARLLLARDPKSDEALDVLRRAEKYARQDASGGVLRCELAQLLIVRGEFDDAEEILTLARRNVASTHDATGEELLAQAEAALQKAKGTPSSAS